MAKQIARALNRLTREGCDFFEASDSSALLEFIEDYMGGEEDNARVEHDRELPGQDDSATGIIIMYFNNSIHWQ